MEKNFKEIEEKLWNSEKESKKDWEILGKFTLNLEKVCRKPV